MPPSALFFQYFCKKNAGKSKDIVAWSKVEPILAVASETRVLFFQEEGEQLMNNFVERSSNVTKMEWQPESFILAIGWADGVISLWNLRDRLQREDDAVHKSPITLLKWKDDGTRLVTGDRRGAIGVWQTDIRGRLMPICHYRKNGAITHCVFAAFHGAKDHSRCTSFFFGGDQGVVSYADDIGHCMDVQSLRSPVFSMLYYKGKDRVVIITESMLLLQLEISPSGKVSPIKVKLSASVGSTNFFRAFWVGPGLLLTSSGEQLLRFWDLGNENNYIINITDIEGKFSIPRLDEVSAMAFCRNRGSLVVGTTSGCLLMWNFCGRGNNIKNKSKYLQNESSVKQTSANNWQLVFQKKMLGRIMDMKWGFQAHLLSVQIESKAASMALSSVNEGGYKEGKESNEGKEEKDNGIDSSLVDGNQVCILNETALQASMNSQLACVQQSPDELIIEVAPGSLPPNMSRRERDKRTILLPLRCGVRIRGLTQSGPRLAVWNGSQVEVYELQGHSSSKKAGVSQSGVGSMPQIVFLNSFDSRACKVGMSRDHIFMAIGSRLDVTNSSGVVKQTLSFTDVEGDPVMLDVNVRGTHMAVATNKGLLKIFSVSRREVKQIGTGAQLLNYIDMVGKKTCKANEGGRNKAPHGTPKLRSIRCNADGTLVSILIDRKLNSFHTEGDSRIYVFNTELSSINTYDFGPERYPTSHLWDTDEGRLLVTEACLSKPGSTVKSDTSYASVTVPEAQEDTKEDRNNDGETAKGNKKGLLGKIGNKKGLLQKMKKAAKLQIMINKASGIGIDQSIISTLFATTEHGILQQDFFTVDRAKLSLMGVNVPYLYFIVGSDNTIRSPHTPSSPTATASNTKRRLRSRLMRDFVGLDRVDETTKKALLEFSYYLTIGNMDAAYRSVKLIQSPSVWENMAHMCVKTKRLDVAEVCLGNMGHARGAKAVREAKANEPEHEARVAMVAVQLGLLEDAERLYTEGKRFDLLNELYQASGQWKEALTISEKQDRIHLKSTHYMYAKHLEKIGDSTGAMEHYEAANSHRYEVPRMLFDAERLDDLQSYIKRSRDPKLLRWWAQYCESVADLDGAMRYYIKAEDHLSQVRIHCFRQEFDEAAETVFNAPKKIMKAAAYHLARQHEGHGNIKEAINFFVRAGRYNHAVRIAKRGNLNEELLALAKVSPKSTMTEAAKHFESQKRFEEAVLLYSKSDNLDRALSLCFKEKLFEQLRSITEQLASDDPDGDGDPNTKADPQMLARCAEFFMDHGEFEKAVHISITAGKPDTALELCVEHRIKITDEMAERMTPAKKSSNEPGASAFNIERSKLLTAIARCCKKQCSYHLACKLYTLAGDKMKALAALLKSGDTDKIIFFATVSRSRDVYVLVANYLQNLDWRNEKAVMKAIIQFYTKARSFAQLAAFYESCAAVEVDEYRDYEKALTALKSSLKYLGKLMKSREQAAANEDKVASIQRRCSIVERFIHARSLVKSDPTQMVSICEELLDTSRTDEAVQSGDIYALLIQCNHDEGNMDRAMELIDRYQSTSSGRRHTLATNPFFDQEILRNIFSACDRDFPKANSGRGENRSSDDGSMSEELEESIAGSSMMSMGSEGRRYRENEDEGDHGFTGAMSQYDGNENEGKWEDGK